jgi:DNA-binding NarL/FixJ family response regulator
MGIKLLLADDKEVVRRAIRTLLAEHAGIKVVGEANGFSETFRTVDSLGRKLSFRTCT